MRPRRGREAPGGTRRTKRGRSDARRSRRTKRTAREAIRILGPLANEEDDGEKRTAEQGDGLGGRQHAGSTRSIGRHGVVVKYYYQRIHHYNSTLRTIFANFTVQKLCVSSPKKVNKRENHRENVRSRKIVYLFQET